MQSFSNLPDQGPAKGLPRISSIIKNKFKPSAAARNRIGEVVEGEVVAELEDEGGRRSLERQIVVADGRLRGEHFLIDEQNKLSALSAVRALDFQSAVYLKNINTINAFWRQTSELEERYPDDETLRTLVAEERKQFLRERRNREIK